MGYSYTMPTAATNGTYGRLNSIVGQIKDKILEVCPFAAVAADNNPANTVKRVISLKFGNSMHYLRLEVTTGTAFILDLRKIDNSGSLGLSTTVTPDQYLLLLFGAKTFVLSMTSSRGYKYVFFKDKAGDVIAMYTRVNNSEDFYWYPPDTDNYIWVATGLETTTQLEEGTNKRILIPLVFMDNTKAFLLSGVVPDGNVFMGSSLSTISQDPDAHYYFAMVAATASKGVLFKDV